MSDLYCDGGVIGANPSDVGGTWAFRIIESRPPEDAVITEASGLITPDENLPAITNNLTEMLALVRGLQALPEGWAGTVYSDSQITLGRAFMGWKWKNIPAWLHHEYQQARARLNWQNIRWVLLSGHPTRAELANGISKSGRPVSAHNVWCDMACGKVAEEYVALLTEMTDWRP